MDIWEPEKIFLFLALFMPGFVSIKVYELIIASRKRDFKNSLLEAVGFSVLNFTVLSWLIIIISSGNFYNKHPVWFFLSLLLIFIFFPALWPIAFIKLSRWRRVAKYILGPIKMPWDYVFSKREPAWIIVHLKDGRKIGGIYGKNSITSAYPDQRQIYLQELWNLDGNGAFIKKVEGTKGILLFEDEILMIELFN